MHKHVIVYIFAVLACITLVGDHNHEVLKIMILLTYFV